jgi:hypothetical protein
MTAKWGVNLLGLVGAILGIVAIFSRWIGNWLIDLNLIDVINLNASEYLFASVLVILGVVIALLSPLGGFFETVGASWFILVYADRHEGAIVSNIGPYLAIASAIIVMMSMVRPIGPGLMHGPFTIGNRLLVLSRAAPLQRPP